MSCIEFPRVPSSDLEGRAASVRAGCTRPLVAGLAVAACLQLAGCGVSSPPPSTAPVGPAVVPLPRAGSADAPSVPLNPAPGTPGATRPRELPPPVAARNWDDFRRQAALRMVAEPQRSTTRPFGQSP